MQKLKLVFVLPVLQFVVASILLYNAGPPDFYVSTPRLICWGLNAPALLFRVLALWGPISKFVQGPIFGIDPSDLFFLVGVIVVWYFVGRALDQRRASKTAARSRIATAVAVHGLLLVLGAFLFYTGLHDFTYPTFGNLGYRPERALLTLAWAASLILVAVKGVRRHSPKRKPPLKGRI